MTLNILSCVFLIHILSLNRRDLPSEWSKIFILRYTPSLSEICSKRGFIIVNCSKSLRLFIKNVREIIFTPANHVTLPHHVMLLHLLFPLIVSYLAPFAVVQPFLDAFLRTLFPRCEKILVFQCPYP